MNKSKDIKKQTQNPFDMEFTNLDDEAAAYEALLDSDDYSPISDAELLVLKDALSESAKRFLQNKKEKGVYIRINEGDLINIKYKAKRAGLPYQTYLKAFIHKLSIDEIKLNI